MFRKDTEAAQAKVQELEGQLRRERIRPSVIGSSNPIEVSNLREELRQLTIINDDLSNKVEEVVEKIELIKIKLWEWEAKQPPSFSLYRTYELQRDLFFILYDCTLEQELDEDEFMMLWLTSRVLKKDDLLVEICTRQDLKVTNFLNTLVVMGDLGARTLLYFRQLEFQIQLKRQIDHAVETNRHIDMERSQT
jgi:hypothetical protein